MKNKQWQGLVNRNNGEALEQVILAACDYYRRNKIAEIDKTPEPFRVLSGRKRLSCGAMGFEGVFTKKAQPDFKGTLFGGQAVVFEAKMTTTDRISQSAVNEAQTAALDYHKFMGAKCFVVVSINLEKFYRVPWGVWPVMREYFGHKYMDADDLRAFEIQRRNGILQILKPCEWGQ